MTDQIIQARKLQATITAVEAIQVITKTGKISYRVEIVLNDGTREIIKQKGTRAPSMVQLFTSAYANGNARGSDIAGHFTFAKSVDSWMKDEHLASYVVTTVEAAPAEEAPAEPQEEEIEVAEEVIAQLDAAIESTRQELTKPAELYTEYQRVIAMWEGRTGEGVRALLNLADTSGGYLTFKQAYYSRANHWATIGEAAADVLRVLTERLAETFEESAA